MTDSDVSDQNPNNVLCILDGVLWNGNDLEKFGITEYNTTETRQSRLQCDRADRDRITFRQYLIIPIMPTVFERITSVSVGSLSCHYLISVGLHSVESGRSRDRLGRILPGERYKSNFHPRFTGSWSDFWQILIGNGPVKDGSTNRECVTPA